MTEQGQPFPPNQWQPEPRPPVSGHSYAQAPVGNTGVIYGTQQRAVWNPGQSDSRQVCDALKTASLWRFSAFGRVDITIDYGTQGTRKILTVRAPVVMTIPGQFTATATPIDDDGTECTVTLTQATAGARSIARQLVDATAGAVNLSDGATDFFALTASTLTISGVAVVVPALQIVPLVVGAVLNTGSGFQEFEA
jgi:hypothetical protein